jgi:hypothetical protein
MKIDLAILALIDVLLDHAAFSGIEILMKVLTQMFKHF